MKEEDPFILRFRVKPTVWLPLEKGLPIHNDEIWNNLTITKGLPKDSTKWTYMVFSSPRVWPFKDCQYLEKVLLQQKQNMKDFPFSEMYNESCSPMTCLHIASELGYQMKRKPL